MTGNKYWSTGIILKYLEPNRWAAKVQFFDNGTASEDKSTKGTLTTSYFVGLETAIDTIKADAERLGIEFKTTPGRTGMPMLLAHGDGESEDWPMPENWKEILAEQAERIGWSMPHNKIRLKKVEMQDSYGTEIQIGDVLLDEVGGFHSVVVNYEGELYAAHYTPGQYWSGQPHALNGPLSGAVKRQVKVVDKVEVSPPWNEPVSEAQKQ